MKIGGKQDRQRSSKRDTVSVKRIILLLFILCCLIILMSMILADITLWAQSNIYEDYWLLRKVKFLFPIAISLFYIYIVSDLVGDWRTRFYSLGESHHLPLKDKEPDIPLLPRIAWKGVGFGAMGLYCLAITNDFEASRMAGGAESAFGWVLYAGLSLFSIFLTVAGSLCAIKSDPELQAE